MKVTIIADVSGSVPHEQLNTVLFPTIDALESAGHDVWVVFGDTEIRAIMRPKKIRSGQSQLKLVGHGGTDMKSVRQAAQATLKPDFVVTISDGMY